MLTPARTPAWLAIETWLWAAGLIAGVLALALVLRPLVGRILDHLAAKKEATGDDPAVLRHPGYRWAWVILVSSYVVLAATWVPAARALGSDRSSLIAALTAPKRAGFPAATAVLFLAASVAAMVSTLVVTGAPGEYRRSRQVDPAMHTAWLGGGGFASLYSAFVVGVGVNGYLSLPLLGLAAAFFVPVIRQGLAVNAQLRAEVRQRREAVNQAPLLERGEYRAEFAAAAGRATVALTGVAAVGVMASALLNAIPERRLLAVAMACLLSAALAGCVYRDYARRVVRVTWDREGFELARQTGAPARYDWSQVRSFALQEYQPAKETLMVKMHGRPGWTANSRHPGFEELRRALATFAPPGR